MTWSKKQIEEAKLAIRIGEYIIEQEYTIPRRRKMILLGVLLIVILIWIVISL